jgi:hypothetical protein
MLFGYHQAPFQGIGNLRRSVASLSAGGIKQPISFRIVFPGSMERKRNSSLRR